MKRLLTMTAAALTLVVLVVAPGPARADSTATWASVSTGGFHTCAIQADGRLYCWGSNDNGGLGDGTFTSTDEPVAVGGATWKSISAGSKHTCALRTSGSLFCWGRNDEGQLGDGTTTIRTSPRQIGGGHWKTVSAGTTHTCGISESGRLYCWGDNASGWLGDGTTTSRLAPRQIGTSSGWSTVQTGMEHTCATTSRRVYCWGENEYGQLGLGNTSDRHSPRRVGGSSDWAQLSAGLRHTCGIRAVSAGRREYCWGRNNAGQLGDNSTSTALVPRRSGTSNAWLTVSLGAEFSCGLRSSARYIYCNGNNLFGAIGDGSETSKATATREVFAYTWSSVEAGLYQTCGIRASTSYLYCWGNNGNGQIGDGTTTARTVPTRVS